MHPKDPTPDVQKCGAVYRIDCANCDKFYIGESARNLGVRIYEHTKKPSSNSAVKEHLNESGHHVNPDKNIKILTTEQYEAPRKIKEAIEIYQTNPPLNRDGGYVLPPVYFNLLQADHQHPGGSTPDHVTSRSRDPVHVTSRHVNRR